jgi:iron complex outermembrane recepter protein
VLPNLQAAWLSKFVGKQYLDNTESESLALESYFVQDLRFSYTIHPKEIKDITLSLLVNNLFDLKYSSNGYVYENTPYFFPQAGRNFLAMVAVRF